MKPVGGLVEMSGLACIDVEALPFDDGAIAVLGDFEACIAWLMDLRLAGGDPASFGVRERGWRGQQNQRGDEPNSEGRAQTFHTRGRVRKELDRSSVMPGLVLRSPIGLGGGRSSSSWFA